MEREVVCFVIGPTGVGKTKLSIQLATARGEVVSADSMQVYEGADVMTAKVTEAERKVVPHHLVDVLSPLRTDWHVGVYQDLALRAVADIQNRGKIPFVVGGTMYYIEALLFDLNYQSLPLTPLPDEDLWTILQTRDPEYAAVTARTNLRKVENAVKYILATGQPYSQRGKVVSLRFPRTCVLWLRASPEVLEKRVRDRVDSMVACGGLDEVRRFLALSAHPNFSKGVLQSIGYKEFHEYLLGRCTLEAAKESLVQSTLRYTRKQEKWIQSRLLPHLQVHELDTSDLGEWDKVAETALALLQASLSGPQASVTVQRTSPPRFECERCSKTVVGFSQWKDHLHSKAHRNFYKRRTRKPKPEVPPSFLFDEEQL